MSELDFEGWYQKGLSREDIEPYDEVFSSLPPDELKRYAQGVRDSVLMQGYSPINGNDIDPEELVAPLVPYRVMVDPEVGTDHMTGERMDPEDVPREFWLISERSLDYLYDKESSDSLEAEFPLFEDGVIARIRFQINDSWFRADEDLRQEVEENKAFYGWNMYQQGKDEILEKAAENNMNFDEVLESVENWEEFLNEEIEDEEYRTNAEKLTELILEQDLEEMPEREEVMDFRDYANERLGRAEDEMSLGKTRQIPDQIDNFIHAIEITVNNNADIKVVKSDLATASEAMDDLRNNVPQPFT